MEPVDVARLARALAALPRLERAVYRAASVEGLGNAEIAARLRIDVATVEQVLGSALVALEQATR
ncbi:sigma factor-like helix-turn-helix DNA-binding protein [Sphingomonas sp. DC2300-3]|uniref:sigma factor-like helix-turn-helix DNA-binding protein n=1 Tax=unclassified Sphingomonas TaxID=196159 RepID=UPI003CE6E6AC